MNPYDDLVFCKYRDSMFSEYDYAKEISHMIEIHNYAYDM